MILTCPQCTTRYQTDASLFAPPGRKVKCAKCGHVWLQAAPPPEPVLDAAIEESPPPPEPETEQEPQREAFAPSAYVPTQDAYDERTEDVRPRGSWLARVGIVVGWLVLAGIVLVIGWATATYRQQIATLWPQSATLYKALGLKVTTRGIDIRNLSEKWEKEGGQSVLEVSGTLLNVTQRELMVPQVSVTLTDEGKRKLYQWSISPGVGILKPGQSVNFHTRLPNPPPGVRYANVGFGGNG